jgi:hypothetical protein
MAMAKTKRIRMLTSIAGVDFSYGYNQVVDHDAVEADRLVQSGQAEYTKSEITQKSAATEPAPAAPATDQVGDKKSDEDQSAKTDTDAENEHDEDGTEEGEQADAAHPDESPMVVMTPAEKKAAEKAAKKAAKAEAEAKKAAEKAAKKK